ncbi:MAG TPA: phosphate signaling complex protein PhoU [Burkholderiaceae bacterium]|nr:phosphate signaling complex protein PhoU [Burkholderiaceae bacterium]
MNEHTLKAFDTDIAGLRRAVTEMGSLAERQFRLSVQAVGSGDPGLVAQVLADERVINALHVRIDTLCNTIIALRQPIAVDLREIIGVIHTINDVERIGDEAKKIALKARNLGSVATDDQVRRILGMAETAADMVRRAIDAFVRHDTGMAVQLGACDDTVDDLRDELVAELTARMTGEPDRVAQMLDLILIVQSIERVADHAENVAEYIVHVVDGVDMRHGNLPA